MKLDADSVIVAAKDQPATAIDGEVVILGMSTARYYGVNAVGARIWQIVQAAPTSVAAIRDTIVAEYAVDLERCEADVIALANQLLEAQLIEVRPARSAPAQRS
jgi:hypothetical protein